MIELQRWKVGRTTITCVVENQTDRIPPEAFFPAATRAAVAKHAWLVPDFADEQGRLSFSVQAFVIDQPGRRIVVDPCVGNNKKRTYPFWNEKTWPFLERFARAGFSTDSVALVVHTHLHADHLGWGTRLESDSWVPTFARARYLYTQRELDYRRTGGDADDDAVYADSIAPIVDAGLSDIVAEDADLGDGVRLEPTPGHTPGHISLWVESDGETALITGDFLHHPVQFAEPSWVEIADWDAEAARHTRQRMFERACATGALVIGTHFPTRPAGRVVAHGDAWRFVPC